MKTNDGFERLGAISMPFSVLGIVDLLRCLVLVCAILLSWLHVFPKLVAEEIMACSKAVQINNGDKSLIPVIFSSAF